MGLLKRSTKRHSICTYITCARRAHDSARQASEKQLWERERERVLAEARAARRAEGFESESEEEPVAPVPAVVAQSDWKPSVSPLETALNYRL